MKAIQIQQIDFDQHLIKEIIDESNNIRQIIEQMMKRKNISSKKLTQSIRIIKQNHKKLTHQFEKNKPTIKKLSSGAAKSITKQLKLLDGMILNLPGTKSRKLVMCIDLHFMRMDYENLVEEYGKFGTELRIYQELVRNASKQA